MKILSFLCNWCSYAGADLAGTSRIQYPAINRVVRVPCSTRINPFFLIRALQAGYDATLVSGCHPGDCHYITGNYYARRKFDVIHDLLTFSGIEAERLRFSWVSASEGKKFADVIKTVSNDLKPINKNKPGLYKKDFYKPID